MRLSIVLGVCITLGSLPIAWGQSLSERPGTIRTGMGVPMRSTASPGTFYGTPWNHSRGNHLITGTSLTVSGNGWHVNVNGNLARELVPRHGLYGYSRISTGSRGTTCVSVPNADEALARVPEHVRKNARVLRGADYGWAYDVICLPGSRTNYIYVPRGYAHGWWSSGLYYTGNQVQIAETAGWGTLNQPATSAPTQPAAPIEPPTALEMARVALIVGDGETAIEQYREHILENTEDSEALREYALTMLELGRHSDGFAAMRKAYRDMPDLAAKPMNLEQLGFDASRIRRLMSSVSPEANKIQTSSAWLTLAVLLQAQEKRTAAERMLGRSHANGLDEPILIAMRSALKR